MQGKLTYGSIGMIMLNPKTGHSETLYVYGWLIEEKGSRYHYVVTDSRMGTQGTCIYRYDKRNDKNGYSRNLSAETRELVRDTLYYAAGHDIGLHNLD